MSSEPLISIALCTYNGARFLREQLDSLLGQTYRHIEIVAVDDASTDDTPAILNHYAVGDARVRVHINAENLGFRSNFEKAIRLCSGDYVAPCDQDDIWLPRKLEALLQTIGSHALAYCDSEFIDEQGRPSGRPMSGRLTLIDSTDPAQFAAANCVAGHAMLIRRAIAVDALPVPDSFYYDWWLAAVAAANGGVVYCPQKLVQYRIHNANVTNYLRARPSQKAEGRREARLLDFRTRLDRLAELPGPSRDFLIRLRDLWRARESQWFSVTLAVFMFRHWDRVYPMRTSRARFLPALKFALGLKFKRLSNPGAYRQE